MTTENVEIKNTEKDIKRLTNSMMLNLQKDNEIYLKGLGKDVILSYEAMVVDKKNSDVYRKTFPGTFKRVKNARKRASEFAKKEFATYSNIPSIRFNVINREGKEIETFTIKNSI